MPRTVSPQPLRGGERLSHEYVNRITRAVLQRITMIGGRVHHMGDSVIIQVDDLVLPSEISNQFPAVLGDSTLVSGHDARWSYGFNKVKLVDNSSMGSPFELEHQVLTGEDEIVGTAYNLLELAHNTDPGSGSWLVWGVDVYGDDYPAGFNPLSVQSGVVVVLTERLILNNNHVEGDPNTPEFLTIYTFSAMGSHDGTCDAPE